MKSSVVESWENRDISEAIERAPKAELHITSLRVAVMIGTLNYGGAERQATVLANGLARLGLPVSLLVSYPGGPLCDQVAGEVKLHCLGRRSRWDVIRMVRQLFSRLKEENPDVLYGFMPGANLAACVAKLRFPGLKVVWGIRATNVDLAHYGWGARLASWLERRLSRVPDLIIANSEAGRRDAIKRGFPPNGNFIVIPNGIDVERFRPNQELRSTMRAEWGILPHEKLVGIVARLDAMKDYPNFLKAAARVAKSRPDVRFVSAGVDSGNLAGVLLEQARSLGLEKRMTWAGPRGDLPGVHNALDLLVSSSAFGEGFSNAIGEAMACGKPCVATSVGDAQEIVGDCGIIVPPKDAEALAAAIAHMLERIEGEGTGLGERARQRVVENFAVEVLVRRTGEALEKIG